jgi:2',3'-cyclic-nucleotide 2'-phosphodiesterase (5'-nucleotidase family)
MHFRRSLFSFFFAAVLVSAACRHTAEVTKVDVSYVVMGPQANLHDSAAASIITPYKDSLDKIMSTVIAQSDVAMPKERDQLETLLGNFTADIVLQAACTKPGDCADLCLLNTGGLRSSLPKGNITRGNIFELMPFDNEIVIVTLTGAKTKELLRYIAASGGQPVAGFKMGLKSDKSPGAVLIKGMPFDSTKTYRVATSDYLANGGDKMEFFKNPVSIYATGIKIRDALIGYCQQQTAQGKTLSPKLDGRIYYESR